MSHNKVDIQKVDIKTFSFSPKEFRCNRDSEGTVYVHRFPVIKHNSNTTLESELLINGESGEIIINVYDMNHNLYAPYYGTDMGNFSVILTKINNCINRELKRLGIKKNDERTVRKS